MGNMQIPTTRPHILETITEVAKVLLGTLTRSVLVEPSVSLTSATRHLQRTFESVSHYGEVEQVTMMKYDNGDFRGFCFVKFADIAAAKEAHETLHGLKVRERGIRVDFAHDENISEERFAARDERRNANLERRGYGRDYYDNNRDDHQDRDRRRYRDDYDSYDDRRYDDGYSRRRK